jgi:hypothetical protein
MRKNLFIVLLCFLLAGSAFAQKTKPWTDWSKKDADKMINDSAWAQSIARGETPPSVSRNANEGRMGGAAAPSSNEAITEFNFRIRFISAKPIREGFARRIALSQPEKASELTPQLQGIIDKGFGDYIIVAVNIDGKDSRAYARYLGVLARLTTTGLGDKVYLERKDGKRLPLLEYKAPIADDMGGKFIFARAIDGAPFLASDSDFVRFVFNVPDGVNSNPKDNIQDKMKLDVKFKVSGMTYGDKLEY